MAIPHLRRLFQLAARRRQPGGEIDAEIEAHFALIEADLIRQGLSPGDARAEAVRRFGDLNQARTSMIAIEQRRQQQLSWRDTAIDWASDVRLAVRHAIRQPGLTVTVWATLTVGVGAATAAYSVLRSVIVKPLPYSAPAELVRLWEHNRPRNQLENVVSPANYVRWKERSQGYQQLAIYTWADLTLVGDNHPQTIPGRSVESNLFSLLGAAPALGRTFTADDAGSAVILSDALWRTRFGADRSVIGRQVPVAGGSVEIVGVMPASFRPLGDEEFWTPFRLTPELREPHGRYAMVVGRLRPGVTVAAAQAEADRIGAALEGELPAFDKGWGIRVVGFHQQVVGEAKPVLLIIAAAVGLVLLIAIANVANLLIAQAVTRLGEVSLRTALGGSPGRLARTWTIEALVQVGGATATGLAVGVGLLRLLRAAPPELLPRANELAVDGTVVGAVILLALIVGIGYGTIPLWTLGPMLQVSSSGRRTTEGGRPGRVRDLLVVGQIAVSIVLLVGAGLLLRSLARLAGVDPGVTVDRVATFSISIPSDRYGNPAQQETFFQQLDRRLALIPGMTSVGSANFIPLAGFISGTSYSIPGTPVGSGAEKPAADIQTADSGYFATLGIPLVDGRLFSASDRVGSARVVLVNRQFARINWPGQSAIGRRIKVSWSDPDSLQEIVGVVGDVTYRSLETKPREAIYFPLSQQLSGHRVYFTKGRGPVANQQAAIGAVVSELDREVPINSFAPLAEQWKSALASRRQPLILLATMAAIAVGLALVGIYGVLSYAVRQRGREIGIRSALGASRSKIAWSVMKRGLGFATVGAVIGALAAGGLARWLGSLLYGTAPTDPITFGLVVVAMIGFAGLASALPAHQATRIDPATALRAD